MEARGQLINKRIRKPEIIPLSVSKVKTFLQCKAKYKFSYIDKLPKKEWDYHIFGKFLHEVLEFFHQRIIEGYNGPDHSLMKEIFDKSLKGTWGHKMTLEQKKECHQILSKYLLKRSKEKETLPTTLHVEKSFNVLVDNTLLINGFIDVVQRDLDGVLHVADYKTSKDKKYLKKDFFQLKTYAYVMCLEDPTLEKVRCSYIMLRHDFDPIEVEFSRNDVLEVEKYYLDKAADIRKEKLYRPNPSPLCGYCDFLSECDTGQQKMGIVKKSFGKTDW